MLIFGFRTAFKNTFPTTFMPPDTSSALTDFHMSRTGNQMTPLWQIRSVRPVTNWYTEMHRVEWRFSFVVSYTVARNTFVAARNAIASISGGQYWGAIPVNAYAGIEPVFLAECSYDAEGVDIVTLNLTYVGWVSSIVNDSVLYPFEGTPIDFTNYTNRQTVYLQDSTNIDLTKLADSCTVSFDASLINSSAGYAGIQYAYATLTQRIASYEDTHPTFDQEAYIDASSLRYDQEGTQGDNTARIYTHTATGVLIPTHSNQTISTAGVV